MPTLLVDGQPVAPNHAQIYYRRSTITPLEAFPPGLRMIAGDAKATQPAAAADHVLELRRGSPDPPVLRRPDLPVLEARGLRLHVTFPSCWDGTNLDSASHQSHMAYPRAGRCPDPPTHALPMMAMILHYPVTGDPWTEPRVGRRVFRARRLLQRVGSAGR